MVKLYKDFLEQIHHTMGIKVELIVLLCFWVNFVLPKPIQKSDSVPKESVSKRLNSELQDLIRLSMLETDLRILRTLPEEKLSLMEELLRIWSEGETVEEDAELPQGDEPMEDVYLSDSPVSPPDVPPEDVEDNSTLNGSPYSHVNGSKSLREM